MVYSQIYLDVPHISHFTMMPLSISLDRDNIKTERKVRIFRQAQAWIIVITWMSRGEVTDIPLHLPKSELIPPVSQ